MRRVGVWIGAGLALALLGATAVLGPRVLGMARVGAGYVAKQVCSCHYVAGRSVAACRADQLPMMDRVGAALLEGREGVRAWVLGGLVERTALHEPGGGCTLYVEPPE